MTNKPIKIYGKTFAILFGMAFALLPFLAFASGPLVSFYPTGTYNINQNVDFVFDDGGNGDLRAAWFRPAGNFFGNQVTTSDTWDTLADPYQNEIGVWHILIYDTTDTNQADCFGGTYTSCLGSSAFEGTQTTFTFSTTPITPMTPTNIHSLWTNSMTTPVGQIIATGIRALLALLAGLIGLGILYYYVRKNIGSSDSNTFYMIETESFKRRKI